MPRLSWTAFPALLAVACGGGTPPPNEILLPPPSSASASPISSAPPVASTPSGRPPPDAILRYWGFDARPRLAAYADLGGLLRTELGRAVVPATLSLAQ